MGQNRLSLGLWLLALMLLLLVGAAIAYTSPPIVIDQQAHNVQIHIEAARGWVIGRVGCVDVQWQTDNLREIYLNGNPTIGTGSENVCAEPVRKPIFRIISTDGDVIHVPVPIVNIMGTQPFIAASAVAGVLVLVGVMRLATVRSWWNKTDKRHALIFGGIVLLGFTMRVMYIARPGQLDETATFLEYARLPLSQLVTLLDSPNNHIFHNILVHGLWKMLGMSLWVLRIPALTFGVLLMPLTYWATRRLFGDGRTALVAMLLVALDTPLAAMSTNGRGYTMIAAFLLVLIVLGTYLESHGRWWIWGAYALIAALAFYTNRGFFMGMVLAALWFLVQIITVDTPSRRRTLFVRYTMALALGAVLTLLFYAPVALTYGLRAVANTTGAQVVSTPPLYLFTIPMNNAPLVVIWGLNIIALVGLVALWRMGTRYLAFGLTLYGVFLIAPLIFRLYGEPRFWLLLTPPFMMIVAVGLTHWLPNKVLIGGLILFTVFALFVYTDTMGYVGVPRNDQRTSAEGVALHIKQVTDDDPFSTIRLLILEGGSGFPFDYYAHYYQVSPIPDHYVATYREHYGEYVAQFAQNPDEYRLFIINADILGEDNPSDVYITPYLPEGEPVETQFRLIDTYRDNMQFVEVDIVR